MASKDKQNTSIYSPYDSVRTIAFEKTGNIDNAVVHLTSSKNKKADVWFNVILNNDLYGKSIEDKVRNCIDMSSKNRSGLDNVNPNVISKIVSYIRNNYRGRSLSHSYMVYSGELYHHGILGQKWGVRRFQNEDGSLTNAGRDRYGVESERKKSNIKGIASATVAGAAVGLNKVSKELAKDVVLNNHATYNIGSAGVNGAINSAPTVLREGASWAKALQTPVGKIAMLTVGTGALGLSIYNNYKSKKLKEIQARQRLGLEDYKDSDNKSQEMARALREGNKSEFNRIRDSFSSDSDKDAAERKADEINKGMIAMVPAGTLPESTRITGKEEEEFWKELAKYYQNQQKK